MNEESKVNTEREGAGTVFYVHKMVRKRASRVTEDKERGGWHVVKCIPEPVTVAWFLYSGDADEFAYKIAEVEGEL